MKCHNCGTVNAHSARFCHHCGTPLQHTCSNCASPLSPEDRFCPQCGQPADTQAPAAQVEKIQVTEITGDRKLVTTLFADVVGSTSIVETMDPEDWTAIMNRAFELLSPPIYEYEGTIARLLGDALLALFGAPLAHEDDAVRAVHAALDLVDAARAYADALRPRYSIEFAVRVGISTGLVVVGQVGSDLKSEYTAMGDAVNLAARLQGLANPMSILISEYTYRFVHPYFECKDLGEVDLKGKTQPVRIYEVVRRKAEVGRTRGIAGLDSRLVGRDSELVTLSQLSAAVQAGLGRVAVVQGEPGIGKSRLVAEWRKSHNLPSAQGQCLSYGQSMAYHLAISLLRSLLTLSSGSEAETENHLREQLLRLFGPQDLDSYPYLGHLLGLRLEGEAEARVRMLDPRSLVGRYADAFRKLLHILTATQPLVLICEDIHWADPSSVELLTRLFPVVRQARLLFCLTLRPERDVPGWRLVTAARELMGISLGEIHLKPLTTEESGELVSSLLEVQALPESTRELILRRSEGNPFFVEEIIRTLIEREVIVRENDRWVATRDAESFDVPDTVMGLLLTRIDRQPEETRHVLRVASVIGRQFRIRVLEQVLAADTAARLSEHLGVLESAGLVQLAQVEPEVAYIFRHALVEEAAYGSLLKRDRQRLHRAVGRALEALYPARLEELAPVLGHHFLEAGEHDKARHYLLMAGENAAHRYANKEAIVHYSRALQVTGEADPSRIVLYHKRGNLYERTGSFEQARADYEAALAAAKATGDLPGEWQALIDLGQFWAIRDYAQTGQYYHRAYEVARFVEDPRRLATTLNRIGNWHINRDESEEGLRYHRQALQLVEELGDKPGILETVDLMGVAELVAGNWVAGFGYYQRTVELARELGNQYLLATGLATMGASSALFDTGVLHPPQSGEDGIAMAEAGLQIARSIGWRSGEAFICGLYGALLGARGDYRRGLEVNAQGLAIAREIKHMQWEVGNRVQSGLIYLTMSAYDQARDAVEPIAELASTIRSVYWARLVAGVLALAWVGVGELDRAEARVNEALRDDDRPNTLAKAVLWQARVEVALARGQIDLAMQHLDHIVAHAHGLDERGERAILAVVRLRARAALQKCSGGDYSAELAERTEASLRYALQLASSYQLLPQCWRLHGLLGDLYHVMGRKSEAAAEHTEAWKLAQRIAETAPSEELRQHILRGAAHATGRAV